MMVSDIQKAALLAVASVIALAAAPAHAIVMEEPGYWASYLNGGWGSITGVGKGTLVDETGKKLYPGDSSTAKVVEGQLRLPWLSTNPGKVPNTCGKLIIRQICTWDNSHASGSRCRSVINSYLAKNPLKDNERQTGDFIEICLPGEDVEVPVETPPSKNDRSDFSIDVVPADPGSYSRDGSNLRAGQSDDLTGGH